MRPKCGITETKGKTCKAQDSQFENARHFLDGVLRSDDEERLSLAECRDEALVGDGLLGLKHAKSLLPE